MNVLRCDLAALARTLSTTDMMSKAAATPLPFQCTCFMIGMCTGYWYCLAWLWFYRH